jgi:hypothetical protein
MDDTGKTALFDFYESLLEAERAGVQIISELTPLVEDPDLKILMSTYQRDEGMNCQILSALIKNAGFTPGTKTGAFLEKIRALNLIDDKLDLLIKGQEWVAKQIRFNRELIDNTASRFFMEAIKVQHEGNVDNMKRLIERYIV